MDNFWSNKHLGLLAVMITKVEDRRFFSHCGVDFIAIGRAFVANLREKKYAQGASTITQQLARTLYLTNDKTILRKIKEILIAFYLEFKYSKEQILMKYIENVYLGQKKNGSEIRGFDHASEYYFNKKLEELNHNEMLSLVVSLKGPNIYYPGSTKGKQRFAYFLGKFKKDLLRKMYHETNHRRF